MDTVTIGDNDYVAPEVSNYAATAQSESSASMSGFFSAGGIVSAWTCWGSSDVGAGIRMYVSQRDEPPMPSVVGVVSVPEQGKTANGGKNVYTIGRHVHLQDMLAGGILCPIRPAGSASANHSETGDEKVITVKQLTRTFMVTPLAFAMFLFVPMPGKAQEVITPVQATSTTTIGAPREITVAISGLGLSRGGASGDVLSETHDSGNPQTHWLSSNTAIDAHPASTTEVLTFDLGGTYDVDTIYLWQYNRSQNNRGIRTFDIAFSADGGSSFGPAVPAATLGMSDFVIGSDDPRDVASVQTNTFKAQAGVTHIRFTNIVTHGSSGYIALPEIRFGGSAPAVAPVSMIYGR